MIEIICQYCKKTFQIKPYRLTKAKYCSMGCMWKAHKGVNLRKTNPYGYHFTMPKWKGIIRSPNTIFKKGQMSGKDNPTWKEPVKLICLHCQTIFYKKPWQIKKRGKGKFNIGYFCSPKCRTEWMHNNLKGKIHPAYVGGKISYYGARWKEQRDFIRQRDGFRCQICGKKRKNIHVHHIRSYKHFTMAEEANQLPNLICICNGCHPKLTHNKLAVTLPLDIDTTQPSYQLQPASPR